MTGFIDRAKEFIGSDVEDVLSKPTATPLSSAAPQREVSSGHPQYSPGRTTSWLPYSSGKRAFFGLWWAGWSTLFVLGTLVYWLVKLRPRARRAPQPSSNAGAAGAVARRSA